MRLPKSLAVRIGGVVAAAAITVTGATAAANASSAAPAAHKIPTTLTISNSTPVAHPHQTTAIVSGHLTAAGGYNLRHLRVWLERVGPKGHWRIVQTRLTRPHGHVFFRVHVFKKAATFRLVFRGTRNFAKSASTSDTISPATAS